MRSLVFVLCVALAAIACSRAETANLTAFHGAKLGMGLRDVRDRFEPPVANGTWNTAIHDGLTVLSWSAPATTETRSAPSMLSTRFEFHNGMLVAVRAELAATDPLAKGEPVSVSKAAVVSRSSLSYTLIAKDCPVHHAEVESILAHAPN